MLLIRGSGAVFDWIKVSKRMALDDMIQDDIVDDSGLG